MKKTRSLMLAVSLLAAVASVPPVSRAEPGGKSPEAAALAADHDDEADLNKAIDAAKKAGLPASAIAEAKMRFFFAAKNLKAVYQMRDELDGIVTGWQPGLSKFETVDEARLQVAFIKALAAKEAHDEKLFRAAITETFSLAPGDGEALGTLVTAFKTNPKADDAMARLEKAAKGKDQKALEQAAKDAFWLAPERADDIAKVVLATRGNAKEAEVIARVVKAEKTRDWPGLEQAAKDALWFAPDQGKELGQLISQAHEKIEVDAFVQHGNVPLDTELMTSDGSKITLKDLLGDRKALYLDFWGSWCNPCMMRMKTLEARGKALKPQGVVVVAINIENFDKGGDAQKAEATRKKLGMTVPWLVEPASTPMQKMLTIHSIPNAWVVDATGKVLFVGHPDDAELGTLLTKNFGATLPQAAED